MEYNSDNILEVNFMKPWKLLYLMQATIGSARFNIVKNTLTPRYLYQKLYSLVNLVACCIATIYLTSHSEFYQVDDEWSNSNAVFYVMVTTTLCLNVCPMIVNNFVYTNDNCMLLLSLQRVDQALKITTNEHHYKKLYRWNMAYVTLLGFQATFNIFATIQDAGYDNLHAAAAFSAIYSVLAQDIEILFFYGIIYSLTLRVKYINYLLIRTVDAKWKTLKQLDSPTIIANIFVAYQNVLKVNALIEKTTGPFLFLLGFLMFCNQLLTLEQVINKYKEIPVLYIFISGLGGILASKIFNRILIAGLLVSHLQQQTAVTKLACLRVISETTNQWSRRHAKNMIRMLSLTRPMAVFGTFGISSMPGKLAAVTATYAVVLLQFYFEGHKQPNTSN